MKSKAIYPAPIIALLWALSPVAGESGPGAKDSLDYPLLPLSIFGEKWEVRAGRLPVLRTYVPFQKGITYQVRAFGEVQLPQDIGAVILNGAKAQAEDFRDLFA